MLRFFETLVDPYVDYPQTDTPPRRLLPFLLEFARPFRAVFVVTGTSEDGRGGDRGRADLVCRADGGPSGLGGPGASLRDHGLEFALVALGVLFLRPLVAGVDVALLHNTILPNFGTLIRWRAHRHVLRQPVGWFENDFAGRIANRIMQTPPAAGDAVFQTFDAMAFAGHHADRRGRHAGRCRSAAGAAAGGLVRRSISGWCAGRCGAPARPPRPRRTRARRSPGGWSMLYQHPFGQAVRPSRPGNGLRRRGDRSTRAQHLPARNAHRHPDGPGADRAERRADRRR